jgi:Fur family ferric uptake transcriptional regulator
LSIPHTEESLRQDLHTAGLRATGPRLAVLQLLRRARLPLSHPEVVAALEDRAWDRATLYRNLQDLARCGLARRTDLGDRVWRFEAAGRTQPAHTHPHFVCQDCGQVTCLHDATVHVESGRKAPRALRTEEFEVQLKGRCDRCRKETR